MKEAEEQADAGLNPEVLLQMNLSFAPSRVLAAGVHLKVFSHVADGLKTVDAIARASGASKRGTRMLLDALTGFQLLAKGDGQYELSPLAAKFLVRERPDYIGSMIEIDALWKAWDNLVEVIRAGKAPRRIEQQETAEQFFPQLVRGLHVLNREPARRAAEILLGAIGRDGLRVVDVACGSGVWSIAFAKADSRARLTAQDFPAMLDVAREYLTRDNVVDRYDFLPGDLKQVDFGENRFDVALLGNIVHSEGERSSRDLFRRLYRALAPGGRIAIIDMIPNDERTGPPFPLIFALNMLLNTEEGGTYTLAEYADWLIGAGFSRVETADTGSHSPLVIGIKN